ncbi:hypothetical protein ACFWWC_28730 [Streptomyces sp. NPDC058642]|uniref:hypothetical protein n=1 Tax=Streptomyces sp. NPDC058642 TaxID=3346572 RepID=UPI00364C6D1F
MALVRGQEQGQGQGQGQGQDTERNRILDMPETPNGPRSTRLAADPAAARRVYDADVERGAVPPSPVWAGEAVDLATDLPPATALLSALAAEAALARAAGR